MPDGPIGVTVTTPPAVAAEPMKTLSREASLGWRACQRAMTGREERLAGPGGREMKPEMSDAANDAPRHFEQLQTDGTDGRRGESCAGENGAPEIREQ